MKNKSNVLYSIPCGCILAFLLVAMTGLILHQDCHAATTATLKLGTSSLNSATVQGETAYLSSTISATTTDTESYVLTVTGPTNLTGATTITGAGGKTGSTMSNNTWGYSYNQTGDNSSKTYASFTGAAQTLESGTIADGSIKNITFAAKFANDAVAGHYTAKVVVGLVATPKLLGVWSNGTNSGITTMQEMTPVICNQVDTPVASSAAGGTTAPAMRLEDTRDGNIYSIAKFPDGRCWMQENLRTIGEISAAASNFNSPSSIIIPNDMSGFDSNSRYSLQGYLEDNTGYYNWYTATAETGNADVTTAGQDVAESICPKNWLLPTGGATGIFRGLTNAIGITTSTSDYGGANSIIILSQQPYNFSQSARIIDGELYIEENDSFWWSSTLESSHFAKTLRVTANGAYPGGGFSGIATYQGVPIRCVASTGGYDASPITE